MNIAQDSYTLYGWEVSYYVGKVRSYLRQKGIGFLEVRPDVFEYYFSLTSRTHARAIPVLRTPDGMWLQDSSAIIDHLESVFPENPVRPATPIQRFASLLFELWGDEFWWPTGLHTRWSHMPENYPFLEREIAGDLLPGWPWPVQRVIVRLAVRQIHGFLNNTGVVPDQYQVLDRWTALRIDQLDAHFADHDFLFGSRPSIGDFGIMAPLYGHLSRDPWPREHLISPRKHLSRWLERMNGVPAHVGSLLPDDAIPPTLEPLLRSMFAEMVPYLKAVLTVAAPEIIPGKVLPRFMARVTFPFADENYTRRAMPYCLWMLQRLMDDWRALSSQDSAKVAAWATTYGGGDMFDWSVPRVERRGLQISGA